MGCVRGFDEAGQGSWVGKVRWGGVSVEAVVNYAVMVVRFCGYQGSRLRPRVIEGAN